MLLPFVIAAATPLDMFDAALDVHIQCAFAVSRLDHGRGGSTAAFAASLTRMCGAEERALRDASAALAISRGMSSAQARALAEARREDGRADMIANYDDIPRVERILRKAERHLPEPD